MRATPETRGAPGAKPEGKTAGNVAAFTLLEICLAIFIAVMIMLAAVPSLSGVLQDQRAKKRFFEFDDLARQASVHAVTERRPYVIAWDDDGVFLRPREAASKAEAAGIARVDFGEKMAPDLKLPAALEKNPPRVWTFWPTGTCEPAVVTCHIADAPWTATYDPLTEQPVFTSP